MSTIECVGPAREQAQCRVHGGCWRSCRVPPHVPDWRARRECACIPMRDYRVHAQNEINDRLHGARPARSAPFAVVPSSCRQFPVPAQQRVQRAQRFATECVRFSREPLTFAVSEADAASAQAFFEQAILFLKVVDQIQLMTVDPSGEHHQQQVKRLEQGRHAAEYIDASAMVAYNGAGQRLSCVVCIIGHNGTEHARIKIRARRPRVRRVRSTVPQPGTEVAKRSRVIQLEEG